MAVSRRSGYPTDFALEHAVLDEVLRVSALRFAIESIKKDVPIWKKEHFEDGTVWVQEGS